MTLRTKLIVWIVALITAVCAVIGVTTEIFLSQYLVKQVDFKVTELNNITKGGDRPRNGGIFINEGLTCADTATAVHTVRGQTLGGMSVVVEDGEVTSSGILSPIRQQHHDVHTGAEFIGRRPDRVAH